MKKLLSFALALALLLTCMSAFAENADDFVYPMEGNPTVSWYINEGYTPNDAYASAEDSPFHTGLREMTGVNIEWSYPTAGTDAAQALNTLLASPKLPDIIFANIMIDAERHMDEGTIIDLTPYIQEHAPNYWKWLQSNPAYDKAMKTDSGKYYGFGFFREDGGWNDAYQGPVIRKDWLDACGLEIPKTISELENVLRTFKEKYNATFSYSHSVRFHPIGLAGAFGAHAGSGKDLNFTYYVDENDKVQFGPAQPEWLAYVLKLQEWWKEGLLDQDVFTLDDTQAKAKALNGDMGVSYTSMGQMSNWAKEAEAAGNGAQWIGFETPTGDDGTLATTFGGPGIGSVTACISGDCPEEMIPTVMRLLDYAYTDEGFLYWNYGKQGVSWDYNADGEVEYLPLVSEDPDGLNDAISKYGGSTWSGCCVQATRMLYLKNTPISIEANNTWFYQMDAKVAGKDRLPIGITMTAEESDEVANYEAAISTYVQEMYAKFVTGSATEADWAAHLESLESMGLSKSLEIRQAAYDRYLAR